MDTVSRWNPPLLQSSLCVLCKATSIVGGPILLFFFVPGIAWAWMFTFGIASAVVVRLPSKWFGNPDGEQNPYRE